MATHIWNWTAFSDEPKNFLILKCCFSHLENIPIHYRYRHNTAIVYAESMNWIDLYCTWLRNKKTMNIDAVNRTVRIQIKVVISLRKSVRLGNPTTVLVLRNWTQWKTKKRMPPETTYRLTCKTDLPETDTVFINGTGFKIITIAGQPDKDPGT